MSYQGKKNIPRITAESLTAVTQSCTLALPRTSCN